MWRLLLVLTITLFTAMAGGGDLSPVDEPAYAEVQCADLPELHRGGAVDAGASGLSLRGLFATLGIGLLSLMFLVPMALFADWLMGRNKTGEESPTVWG